MTLDPIDPQDLKHESWYYGLQCSCGRQLALHEDIFRGNGADFLHLHEETAVKCGCGTRLSAKRLEKYKHSHRGS